MPRPSRLLGATPMAIAMGTILILGTGSAAQAVRGPGRSPAASPTTPLPQPAPRSYGPADALHVTVAGDGSSGYRAEIHDGARLITTRGMTGKYDLTAVPGTSLNQPTGDDLLGHPTGDLDWGGPGSGDGAVAKATAPDGGSAVHWTLPGADNNTWIEVPIADAKVGTTYRGTVTLQGTGTVYLNIYDGARDVGGTPVTLTSQPQTLTLDVPIPEHSRTPQFQIRTSAAGDVDLLAWKTSVRAVTRQPVTDANRVANRYTSVSYDPATATLSLSGATDTIGSTTVTRSETYRFVAPNVIDAQVGTAASGGPAVYWYTPYTDFKVGKPLWTGGGTTSYESPNPSNALLDSPVPALGVSDGTYTYGVAGAATWDEPLPGYSAPHLVIDGSRLAAPQIGTEADPIVLGDGQTRSFHSVFYRSAAGPYGLALGAQLATAETLGLSTPERSMPAWGKASSTATLRRAAADEFAAIAKTTAYWARMTTASGVKALAPNQKYAHFGATTYMRDSFWTTLGLDGTPYAKDTEKELLAQFTRAIPRSGGEAGHVPVTGGGPFFGDESGLYYLIRMYHDATTWGLPAKDTATANLVLAYIRAHQVSGGAFVTAGPVDNAGFQITPDSWLDGYLFPTGAVNAYDQGLYVVALRAAKSLGADVSDAEIDAATGVYRRLYDDHLGYVRWLSTKDFKSPDVLVGDALSLYLFGKPLLTDTMVRRTFAAQERTPYGMKVLAKQDGSAVPPSEFLTLTNDPKTGQVIGLGEPAGWYQNGASWLLWEYLAEYSAARHGVSAARGAMRDSIAAEVAVTPLSKEFKVTQQNADIAGADPAWPYPLGSSGLDRQGFGWNAAVAAFSR
ncbi:hypothetical protein [Actinoallomurus sp. CA-150999]|uniref:hypothetical protein n=1 Tax=Actinoallomurus sp. CA-150999 TaxID=3239887 RepID=UPI003D8CD8AF